MKLVIIQEDATAYIDGKPHEIDVSSIPENVHAVHWDGTNGEIEYKLSTCDHCGVSSKKSNEQITDGSAYQQHISFWYAAEAHQAEVDQARINAEKENTDRYEAEQLAKIEQEKQMRADELEVQKEELANFVTAQMAIALAKIEAARTNNNDA